MVLLPLSFEGCDLTVLRSCRKPSIIERPSNIRDRRLEIKTAIWARTFARSPNGDFAARTTRCEERTIILIAQCAQRHEMVLQRLRCRPTRPLSAAVPHRDLRTPAGCQTF